jgi:NAD-dependent dihydropyrimidine dehydrogenase PreA subunit
MAVSIDTDSCIGCGACTYSCSLDLLELDGDVVVLNDPDACIECGSCIDACPLGVLNL